MLVTHGLYSISNAVSYVCHASISRLVTWADESEYVQIKPLLVVATVILKATGTYREGRFAADSGYTYISVVYNTSICLSL